MTRWFDNLNSGLRRFWHPVALVDELVGEGPHPAQLLGQSFALVRLEGSWTALPDVCPHRLAPLTAGSVVEGTLRCAYHGWRFDSDGTCVAIPALGSDPVVPPTAHLETPARVGERYGLVWVALDEPMTDIPDAPEWGDKRYGMAVLPPQTWHASAGQMADNFLDVAHFPFTHVGTIGDPDDEEVADYVVNRDGWSFEATHHHSSNVLSDAASTTAAQSDEATSNNESGFETFERTMSFRCDAPHHVRLRIDYGPDGTLILLFFHQPMDLDTTRLYCLILAENMAVDTGIARRMSPSDHLAFQEKVAAEDRTLLEQLAIKAVPIEPGVETHTRADRITVELRRVLRDVANLS